jgi:hypothetical protein
MAAAATTDQDYVRRSKALSFAQLVAKLRTPLRGCCDWRRRRPALRGDAVTSARGRSVTTAPVTRTTQNRDLRKSQRMQYPPGRSPNRSRWEAIHSHLGARTRWSRRRYWSHAHAAVVAGSTPAVSGRGRPATSSSSFARALASAVCLSGPSADIHLVPTPVAIPMHCVLVPADAQATRCARQLCIAPSRAPAAVLLTYGMPRGAPVAWYPTVTPT